MPEPKPFNGVHYELAVTVCENAREAIRQGFMYRSPVYLPIRILRAVVVLKGTQQGHPTVDLIMEDEKGQKYAALLTGALLRTIPCD